MQKALFVSDIHIASPDDPRAHVFGQFLDHCLASTPSHLFLVGDIFDLWIADRAYFVTRYADLIAQIRALVATGCEVHYFEGNHDLDLERFWRRDVGVVTHDRPTDFVIAGQRVRVEHGDEMDPADRGYKFLRWLLRTPVLRALGRYLPNVAVRQIGERASRASRSYTSEVKVSSDERTKRVLANHVRHLGGAAQFDVFVSGHVHVAEDTEVAGARVFNLRTWLKIPLVLILGEDATALVPLSEFISKR